MYQLPSQRFMVPASWQRFQLSQLINAALALPRVVPFDFLIHGALLRGSLSESANSEVGPQHYYFILGKRGDKITGGNSRDRVHRERFATFQIGDSPARGVGLIDCVFRTGVCVLLLFSSTLRASRPDGDKAAISSQAHMMGQSACSTVRKLSFIPRRYTPRLSPPSPSRRHSQPPQTKIYSS